MTRLFVDVAASVVHLIERSRLSLSDEKVTQRDIEELLQPWVPFERECRLSDSDIVDFLVDGKVAIEVKIKGQPAAFVRQLARYAAHDKVRELVLVTARAIQLPPTINGKRVLTASLGKGWL